MVKEDKTNVYEIRLVDIVKGQKRKTIYRKGEWV